MMLNRALCAVFAGALILLMSVGCLSDDGALPDGFAFSSYKEIPGVSDADIAEIEALKQSYGSFSYGMLNSTEAFLGADGEVRGYSALMCGWLSELFGIEFRVELHTWNTLFEGLESGDIDFAGDLTASEDRLKTFYMTDAISERLIDYFVLEGSRPLSEIAASRPLRYAFTEGTTTVEYVESSHDSRVPYEIIFVRNLDHAYELLKSGEVDAFFTEDTAKAAFDVYGDVVGRHYFPPIFSHVSMATRNPELRAIIDVVQKALQNGGNELLLEMYAIGYHEYQKNSFLSMLTPEELEYIELNPVIPYVTQYNNYPMSFYNESDRQWQGIAFGLLHEIENLTGLTFKLAHGDEFIAWPSLLNIVTRGDAAFVTELIRTEDRIGLFIYPDTTLASEYLTLVSEESFRAVRLNEVKNFTVGVVRNTAQTQAFYRWFPGHEKIVEYDDTREALLGMRRGEVELVMSSTSNLLVMTNYLELTGFKANIIFHDTLQEASFGLNVEQIPLRTIFDKALSLIDITAIQDEWKNRTFDHRYQLMQAQRPWMIGAMISLVLTLGVLAVVYIRTRAKNRAVMLAQKEAERSSARLKAIMQNLPGMVFQHLYNPPEYTYMFVSQWCEELTGYTIDDFMGENAVRFFDMVHPDDIAAIEKLSAETLAHGLPYETEFRIKTRDGAEKVIWERSHVIEQNPDGTPYLVEGYHTDVTARRQLEAAELASRAKSSFLATMSHEIRTPINSIMGFAELALDSGNPSQIKDYLSKIADSTAWLLRIINDILDISKIEAGRMELEQVPFSLHEVFTRCQSVILPPVKEKGLDLRVYAEPIVGKKLVGDPVRLYQMLMNLLSNAVKFTNEGVVKFSALVREEYDDKALIYFEVQDSGIGMSAEQLDRVFDPFTQADSSTTRNYGGTGLGLAIVKSIVEHMGGMLRVDSAPGSGTTFGFEIMFDVVETSEDTMHREDMSFVEKPHFDALVLVCDDNPMNQEVICEHLLRVGVQTSMAPNGLAGVAMVQERMAKGEPPYDLIFMDIFMPVMDGIEAASNIIAAGCTTPIVAVTANIMASEIEKYKKNGMPECLGKPFTSQELWRLLLKYLKPVSNQQPDGSRPRTEDGGGGHPHQGVRDAGPSEDAELQKRLKVNFVKNNRNIYNEIDEAVAAGDIKLAHRLAHTLKGSAGLIGKSSLRKAAEEIELLLKDGTVSIWESKMNLLKAELTLVLEELAPLLAESSQRTALQSADVIDGAVDPALVAQALTLFDKMEPMLENINPECVSLLDELRTLPGTAELAQMIEDYEFEQAAKKLAELRKKYNS